MKIPLLPDRPRPLIFAHRGCSSLAPENTLAAFRKARETGAPGIELDIHVCRSGELVVAHDDTFARTAGDPRAIADLSWEEIRKIDVSGGRRPPEGAGEHPPLLDEVLEEFCPGMYIDIELKTEKTKDDPLPLLAARKLEQFGDRALCSVTVSSFNPFALAAFKRHCPGVPTAVIWSAGREVPLILRRGFGRFISRCDYLKPVHLQVNRLSRFRFSVLEGRPLVPWTIDDRGLAERLLKTGCEGIITNRPQDFCPAEGSPVPAAGPSADSGPGTQARDTAR
ncbi:MAG: glycerophosphodiester phosphodiesterase [Treponema sp.]|jgi:glycerophosphoryl diester phosphodiesterase|nr:glycerophosphodiester phosphodiesterase [Treponema sp.]